jgi:hypothetical protein
MSRTRFQMTAAGRIVLHLILGPTIANATKKARAGFPARAAWQMVVTSG